MLIILIVVVILLIISIIITFMPVKVSVNYYRLNKDDNLKIQAKALFGLINYRLEISYIKIRHKLMIPFLELHAQFFGAKGKKGEDEVVEEFGLRSFDIQKVIEKLKFLLKIADQYEALFEMIESYRKEDQHSGELSMENAVIYRVMGMLFMGIRGDCKKFVWNTKFGLPDAAVTAITSGAIWTGKSVFLDILSIFCNMKTVPQISVEPSFTMVGIDTKFESIFSIRIGNIMITGFKILLQGYKRRAKING